MFERLFEKLSDSTTKTWRKKILDLSMNANLYLVRISPLRKVSPFPRTKEKSAEWQKPLSRLENAVFQKNELELYEGHEAAHQDSCDKIER